VIAGRALADANRQAINCGNAVRSMPQFAG